VTLQICGVDQTLKLGHKKDMALSRSDSRAFGGIRVHDYLSPAHNVAPWAVPVADSRTPVNKVGGDGLIDLASNQSGPRI
jgi:hypothetical protein